MSEENVEALKAVYENWGAGNFWTPDRPRACGRSGTSPAHTNSMSGSKMSGVGASMRSFLAAWDECRWEADKFIPAQGDRVLVLFTARARGKGSSVEVEAHLAHLWTFRAGKATRLEGFIHQSDALEAAGLRE